MVMGSKSVAEFLERMCISSQLGALPKEGNNRHRSGSSRAVDLLPSSCVMCLESAGYKDAGVRVSRR
jgi:hypothetical protein